MNSRNRTILLINFLLFLVTTLDAQIYKTRKEIIEAEGTNYTSGISNSGEKYIKYENEVTNDISGKFTQVQVIYFTTKSDGTEVCSMTKLLLPASETNTIVKYIENKYVKVGNLKYMDYGKNILYWIKVEMDICILTTEWVLEK